MAKTYTFLFIARKAEFHDGFVSLIFGGRDTELATETKVCTLADAAAHLDPFSAAAPGPHQAYFLMRGSERKPAGYEKATDRHVNKEV